MAICTICNAYLATWRYKQSSLTGVFGNQIWKQISLHTNQILRQIFWKKQAKFEDKYFDKQAKSEDKYLNNRPNWKQIKTCQKCLSRKLLICHHTWSILWKSFWNLKTNMGKSVRLKFWLLELDSCPNMLVFFVLIRRTVEMVIHDNI